LREATVVNTDGADEFFVDITERIANLDRVAARKGRPRRLPVPLRRPESSGAPAGWAAKPLLWLKVAASLAPAPDEDRGMIRQPDREEIKRSLMTSPLTARLRQLSEYRPASALAEREPPPYNVLGLWELLADGFQTASHAAFRIGGDASAGISAILSVGDYGGYPPSGSVFVELDIGFSIESKLLLHQVGQVLRDGLVLVTATIPDAIGDFLPPDAQPATVEIHIVAPTDDGRVTRQNDPGLRVDLGPLGSSTRDLASSWSFAASVSQPFETRSAAEFVVQALERIVLDAGITEPDRGLAELRRALAP
jgi:hypothetical protein